MTPDLIEKRRRAYRLQLLFQLACYTVGFFAGRWIVRQAETDPWDAS